METSRPISPPQFRPAHSLQAAAEGRTHYAQPVMKFGSRSETPDAVARQRGIRSDKMGRLPDRLALVIERCIPAGGPHGALPAQVIGFLRL